MTRDITDPNQQDPVVRSPVPITNLNVSTGPAQDPNAGTAQEQFNAFYRQHNVNNPFMPQAMARIREITAGDDPFTTADDRIRPVWSQEEFERVYAEGKVPFMMAVPEQEMMQFNPTNISGMEAAIDQLVAARTQAAQAGVDGADQQYQQTRRNLIGQIMTEVARAMAPHSGQSMMPGAIDQFHGAQQHRIDARTQAEQTRLGAEAEGMHGREQLRLQTQIQDNARKQQIDQFNSRARMDNELRKNEALQRFAEHRRQIEMARMQDDVGRQRWAEQMEMQLLQQQMRHYDQMHVSWASAMQRQQERNTAPMGRLAASLTAINSSINNATSNAVRALQNAMPHPEAAGFWNSLFDGFTSGGGQRRRANKAWRRGDGRERNEEYARLMNEHLNPIYNNRHTLRNDLVQDISKLDPNDPNVGTRVEAFGVMANLLESMPDPDDFDKNIEWLMKAEVAQQIIDGRAFQAPDPRTDPNSGITDEYLRERGYTDYFNQFTHMPESERSRLAAQVALEDKEAGTRSIDLSDMNFENQILQAGRDLIQEQRDAEAALNNMNW